jgi:hypothetical protein
MKLLYRFSYCSIAILIILSFNNVSLAGFKGNSIRLTVESPRIIDGPHEAIVDESIEFELQKENNVVEVDIDISENTIYFDYSRSSSNLFASGTFNGYIFSDINNSLPNIENVEIIDSETTLGINEDRITFNENQIFINVASLPVNKQSRIKITVHFSPSERNLFFPIKSKENKVIIICM